MKYKALMDDRPMSPLDTALYWVEYVIRHQGAHHLSLKSASQLNFFQYFLLDIIAVPIFAFCLICYLLKVIYRFIRGKNVKGKVKKN